jgi:hypothetical protein
MRVHTLKAAVSLALAAIASLGAANPAAAGDWSCTKVFAVGETLATGQYSFAGVAHTNLGSGADLGDRQVFVTLLSAVPTGTSLRATTSHTFVGPGGAFTTTDNAQLFELSPGLYRLSTQAQVTAGGRGQLSIDGLVDYRTGTGIARWFAHGELCSD